jgi:hypothetical protein
MRDKLIELNKGDMFRKIAMGTAIAGALGSLFLTLTAGQNNKSVILVLLFCLWVLSPFTAMIAATTASKGRTSLTRQSLYISIILITVFSIIGYSGILKIPGAKHAFIFLALPFLSWLVIITFFVVLRFRKAV